MTDLSSCTLEQVIRRLAAHDAVDGVVVMGSAAHDALSAASDYDLLVVLADRSAPLFLTVTTIAGRMAELYFVDAAAIDAIAESDDLPALARIRSMLGGAVLAWLETGRLAFDRSGRLACARSAVGAQSWFVPASADEKYNAWFSVNYNLAHNRRMLTLDDPVYQTAVDLRLLYMLSDLWLHYFRIRAIPWQGEKPAIRYVQAHDPSFLDLLRVCLAETDRGRKMARYEELARHVVAPIGPIWAAGTTAVQLDTGAAGDPGAVEAALAFWAELVREP